MARLMEGKRVGVLTIELNPKNRRIIQIRGHGNRAAKRWKMKVIREWVNKNNLII